MSGKEQISIGIRFFDSRKKIIREEFMGFMELDAMDAATIVANIKGFVEGFDLDPAKCVGLGFDGCATMAGNTSGVHKILYIPKKLLYSLRQSLPQFVHSLFETRWS
uniref:Uncharacterized protein n=1 Tax=Bactrocera latifrons TaxID=174628 RepID=A0A0K8WKM6_BACLA